MKVNKSFDMYSSLKKEELAKGLRIFLDEV